MSAIGDAYIGALAVALADGRELIKSLGFAAAAAALFPAKNGGRGPPMLLGMTFVFVIRSAAQPLLYPSNENPCARTKAANDAPSGSAAWRALSSDQP
jgi:sugar/nucleoside kinase (ribokinase family)